MTTEPRDYMSRTENMNIYELTVRHGNSRRRTIPNDHVNTTCIKLEWRGRENITV